MTCCWWCKHDVGGAVIKTPTGYLEHRRPFQQPINSFMRTPPPPMKEDDPAVRYGVEGFFCTFECAKSYLVTAKPHDFDTRMHTLSFLYANTLREKGLPVVPLKKAPSWKTLKIFGGTLTYEEFRSNTDEWIITPKNIIDEPIIVRRKHQPLSVKKTWAENKQVISDTHKPTESLKIKRTNPRKKVSGFGDVCSNLGIKVIVKD